jgi:hypothetical protein
MDTLMRRIKLIISYTRTLPPSPSREQMLSDIVQDRRLNIPEFNLLFHPIKRLKGIHETNPIVYG